MLGGRLEELPVEVAGNEAALGRFDDETLHRPSQLHIHDSEGPEAVLSDEVREDQVPRLRLVPGYQLILLKSLLGHGLPSGILLALQQSLSTLYFPAYAVN